jgi:hypothetical protein
MPFLATNNAYISYKVGDMTITNGQSQKKLVFYPLTKPFIDTKTHILIAYEEGEDMF